MRMAMVNRWIAMGVAILGIVVIMAFVRVS
jgi:hypothetical protein